MQVWQLMLVLLAFITLVFVITWIFGFIIGALPYLAIPHWIVIGTLNVKAAYAKTTVFGFVQFLIGGGFLLLAVINVFMILRRDVEEREILRQRPRKISWAKLPKPKQYSLKKGMDR